MDKEPGPQSLAFQIGPAIRPAGAGGSERQWRSSLWAGDTVEEVRHGALRDPRLPCSVFTDRRRPPSWLIDPRLVALAVGLDLVALAAG